MTRSCWSFLMNAKTPQGGDRPDPARPRMLPVVNSSIDLDKMYRADPALAFRTIRDALYATNGNIAKAARSFGIRDHELRRYFEPAGITAADLATARSGKYPTSAAHARMLALAAARRD